MPVDPGALPLPLKMPRAGFESTRGAFLKTVDNRFCNLCFATMATSETQRPQDHRGQSGLADVSGHACGPAGSRPQRLGTVGSAKALREDLLQRLELFRSGLRNDDETLLVLQREEESRLVVLGEVASSYTFGRLRRSLKKE